MSKDPRSSKDLERLVDPVTRGDPNHRYVGRAKVFANWPPSWSGRAIRCPINW